MIEVERKKPGVLKRRALFVHRRNPISLRYVTSTE
jgi:hypothetical protein